MRSEQAIVELFSAVPPRPAPPAGDEQQIRAAVFAQWDRLTRRRVQRRRVTSVALAASVLLAVFTTLNLLRPPVDDFGSRQLATVERQFGEVSMASIEGSDFVPTGPSFAAITGGGAVRTGAESGLALAWHDGGSLRLDADTTVVFASPTQIHLESGRIYFDSEPSPLAPTVQDRKSALSIRTPRGVVRHLGTQFITEVAAGELRVLVREGVVSIDVGQENARAGAGRTIAVDGFGELIFDETDGFGPEWEWVRRTAPAVNLDGKLVADALEWVGRESGRSIRYASPAAKAHAVSETLVGMDRIGDLDPLRALDLFMATVDLNHRLDGETIVVSDER